MRFDSGYWNMSLLLGKMINTAFDGVDLSKCCSEEAMFLLTLSVLHELVMHNLTIIEVTFIHMKTFKFWMKLQSINYVQMKWQLCLMLFNNKHAFYLMKFIDETYGNWMQKPSFLCTCVYVRVKSPIAVSLR